MFFIMSKSPYLLHAKDYLYYLKFLILPLFLLKWNNTCCIEFFLVKIFISFVNYLTSIQTSIVFFSVIQNKFFLTMIGSG